MTALLPLLAVAYLYITTRAGISLGSDQSRTLSMELTLSPSRLRDVAASSFPYAPLRFPSRAPGLSGAWPLLRSLLPLLSRDFAFPSGLRTHLGSQELLFKLT